MFTGMIPARAALFLLWGGAVRIARQAHNLEVAGSNPAPATCNGRTAVPGRVANGGRNDEALQGVLGGGPKAISVVPWRNW